MLEYDSQGRIKYNPELHDRHGLDWSEDELNYLINWYHIIGLEEMSFALGRTESTIATKVQVLRKRGIMRKNNGRGKVGLLKLEDRKTILTY